MNKITVTLTDKADRYFALLAYGLTKEDGATPANKSECINHVLEAMGRFEEVTDNDILNWLNDVETLTGSAKEFAINPTKENFEKVTEGNKTEPAEAWNEILNEIDQQRTKYRFNEEVISLLAKKFDVRKIK